MCGICGIIHFSGKPVTSELLRAMNERLQHRGPDGDGYFLDANIGLAMRRLRIIDIAGSDQPLYNEDRSLAVIFNGEIYNYRDLRRDLILRGYKFRTDGDGETIAHLYEEYGSECWQRLRGMYAIALWDQRQKRLLLARDRMGQKPLYYYRDQNVFAFASEIKAILAHPDVPRRSIFAEDGNALAEYLSFGYLPAPQTAFQNIHMLPPATCLEISEDGKNVERSYWGAAGSSPALPTSPAGRLHRTPARKAGRSGQAAADERCAPGRLSQRRPG